MKIACIGNMNNNFFTLTRYLRDANLDAQLLLLDSEFGHFVPSSDTFDVSYKEYTSTLPWGDRRNFAVISPNDIARSLKNYDKIICCDVVPAFLAKSKERDADIFVPHGSDLFAYPFPTVKNYLSFDTDAFRFARYQREGIQHTSAVFMGEKGGSFDKIVDKLNITSKTMFVPFPMVYSAEFNPSTIDSLYDKSALFPVFQNLKKHHDFIVMHHTRQFWKYRARTPWGQHRIRFHYKGNDLLIRAFARFVKQHKDCNPLLVMFSYGIDAEASHELVRELDIESNVHWLPITDRKEIMVCISLSDIGTGEFIGGWYSAGVVYENLAMGKPVLHYCNFADPDLYPLINVKTEENIFEAFEHFHKDPESFRLLGQRGAKWYQEHIVNKALAEYTRVLSI